jgi:hypothetical protein
MPIVERDSTTICVLSVVKTRHSFVASSSPDRVDLRLESGFSFQNAKWFLGDTINNSINNITQVNFTSITAFTIRFRER